MKKLVHVIRSRTSITMIAFAIALSIVGVPHNANAKEGESSTGSNSTVENVRDSTTSEDKSTLSAQQRDAMEAKRQELRAAQEAADTKAKAEREAKHTEKQDKLSASKLEICKSREANINSRITRIADRSAKHLALFDTVSERAQAFYTNRGNTLANYDELVADVTAKKTAAEVAVQTIVDTKANFNCEGDNPKVTVEEFKTSLKSAIAVLKEYQTSVKNLIVGIKSVNNTAADDSTSPERAE